MGERRRVLFVVGVALLVGALAGSGAGAAAPGGSVPGTGTVTGLIYDAATSAPLAAAQVMICGGSGSFGATADQSGIYVFSDVPPGTYTLCAYVPDYYLQAVPGVLVVADQTTTVNNGLVPLVPGTGSVTGRVYDTGTDSSLAGAQVMICDGFTPLLATTDGGGIFLFSDVPAASYMVCAQAMGYPEKRVGPVAVLGGQTTTVDVGLTGSGGGTGNVTGLVYDIDTGSPLAGAQVKICDGYFPLVATTDQNGIYLFSGLPAGTYIVCAEFAGYLPQYVAPVAVTADQTTTVDLALIHEAPVPGTLSCPDWYITLDNFGYSDWMIQTFPDQAPHENLSGEWGAAVRYDGIPTPDGKSMWLTTFFLYPDFVTNSNFYTTVPLEVSDDPSNPVVGQDTGYSQISNGVVTIDIRYRMHDTASFTAGGMRPGGVGAELPLHTGRYVLEQTYEVRNVSAAPLTNVSFFQFLHSHPNDDYGPNNYMVYDDTLYRVGAFEEHRYDVTSYGASVWNPPGSDITGFSSSVAPDAWGLGNYPGHFGEPATGLYHSVLDDALPGNYAVGPDEVAGAMKWQIGTLGPGESFTRAVLLWNGYTIAGITTDPEIAASLSRLHEAVDRYVEAESRLHAKYAAKGYKRVLALSDPEQLIFDEVTDLVANGAVSLAVGKLASKGLIKGGEVALERILDGLVGLGLLEIAGAGMNRLLTGLDPAWTEEQMADEIHTRVMGGDGVWRLGQGATGVLGLKAELDTAFASVVVPPVLPPELTVADLVAAIDTVTQAVEKATPAAAEPADECRLYWHMPGLCALDMEPSNPTYIGGTSSQTRAYASAIGLYDAEQTISAVRKWTCFAAIVGLGGVKIAVSLTGVGAVPAEALYWGGVVHGCATSGLVMEAVDLAAWAGLWHETIQYHSAFVSDLNIVSGAVEDTLAQVSDSLAGSSLYGCSRTMAVTAWEAPDLEVGILDTEAAGQATVSVANNDAVAGSARVFMEALVGDTVYQVFPSDTYAVPSGDTETIPIDFSLPASSLFSADHYTARFVVLTSAGVTVRQQSFRVCSILGCFLDDLLASEVGTLSSGESDETLVSVPAGAAKAEFSMGFLGSDFDLHVYDAADRHVGYNYGTATVDLEIPGAVYSGPTANPETISIPGAGGQQFRAVVVAVDVPRPEDWNLTVRTEPARPAALGTGAAGIVLRADPGLVDTATLPISEVGGQQTATGLQGSCTGLDTLLTGRSLPGSCVSVQFPETQVEAGQTIAASVRVDVPLDELPGNYYGELTIQHDGGELIVPLTVRVGPGYSIFEDVPPDHWAVGEVMAVYWHHIAFGYSRDPMIYAPNRPVSRDQMAVYMARAMAGGDENVPDLGCDEGNPPFPDVPCDNWARKYIQYCKDEGIIQGYWNGYHPDEVVSRAQMAVYVARAMAGGDGNVIDPGCDEGNPPFPDVLCDHWARKYIQYCKDQGVVQGYWNGYHPDEAVNRGQMAIYVQRAFDLPM